MKKQFKKLLKKADKSRAKHGFSNKGVSKNFIQIKHNQRTTDSFELALAFDNAVQEIRHDKKGTPEFLDKKCLQDTGFRVNDLNEFFSELTCRMAMADPKIHSEEKLHEIMFSHFQTLSVMVNGKAEICHSSEAHHQKYLRGYDRFEGNQQAVFDFIGFFIELHERLKETGRL